MLDNKKVFQWILTEIFAFELAASGDVLRLRLAGSIGSLLGSLHDSF